MQIWTEMAFKEKKLEETVTIILKLRETIDLSHAQLMLFEIEIQNLRSWVYNKVFSQTYYDPFPS